MQAPLGAGRAGIIEPILWWVGNKSLKLSDLPKVTQ